MSTKRCRVFQKITDSLPAIVSPLSCTISHNFPASSSSTGEAAFCFRLAGPVSLSGLTLAEAQKLIQDRFADGVLVQPAVSVRITDYRPIFVTGNVRKPGSYRFIFGQSVKAADRGGGR